MTVNVLVERIVKFFKQKQDELIMEENVDKGEEEVDDCIIIKPVSKPREGWDAAFSKMADKGDNALLSGMDTISHLWDEEEWEW